MTGEQPYWEKFAEHGAHVIGLIDRALAHDQLPEVLQPVLAAFRDQMIDMTALQVQRERAAERYDTALAGAALADLLQILREHLSPGQLAELGHMLLDENT